MIDYLIIGSGLAGISFAETALSQEKTIFVIDSGVNSSSKVAAGLYNPVILKRFTPVWNAQSQLQVLDTFYRNIALNLQQQFDFKKPILRKFFSIEEQNNWYLASDKKELSHFLSTKLVVSKFSGIDSPFDYGEVNGTGYVDVALLLQEFKKSLKNKNIFSNEVFHYDQLEVLSDGIRYQNIEAKNIIFAEGFGMNKNPFFNDLPLDGVKGELLVIKAPHLALDVIINTSIFILPMGNDLFKVGATYNWNDKTNSPTEEGRQELTDKIKEVLSCDFEIVSHLAGIRPTVRDRKPLVGTHPTFPNIHILNGLGTRGVMLGPSMAKALFNHIEEGTPLDQTFAINRFLNKK